MRLRARARAATRKRNPTRHNSEKQSMRIRMIDHHRIQRRMLHLIMTIDASVETSPFADFSASACTARSRSRKVCSGRWI